MGQILGQKRILKSFGNLRHKLAAHARSDIIAPECARFWAKKDIQIFWKARHIYWRLMRETRLLRARLREKFQDTCLVSHENKFPTFDFDPKIGLNR